MHYGSPGIDALHFADRPRWCAIVAPWWVIQMLLFGDIAIRNLWPIASRDLQRAIWACAPADLRAAITAVRAPTPPAASSGPQGSLF